MNYRDDSFVYSTVRFTSSSCEILKDDVNKRGLDRQQEQKARKEEDNRRIQTEDRRRQEENRRL